MKSMSWVWQDLRFALRGFRKDRGFTLLAVLALALGIGAVTTIFSVIDNVLIEPFPYADSQRLMTVMVHDSTRSGPGGRPFFSIPEFLDYQEQSHVFDRIIGATNLDVLATSGEGTERFQGAETTTNTFSFLGIPPLLGRAITPEDGRPGAPPVFVMSHKMWAKNYSLDRGILGQSFVLNGKPRTLIGIMPPRFRWFGADLWLPGSLDRSDPEAKLKYFFLLGHLKAGVTERQAVSDLDVIAKRLAPLYPRDYPKKYSMQIVSLADSVVGQFRTMLLMLLAAVGMLLLIACGNVANMLLARATAREKEIAIRSSLGASRWRLIGQLMIESVLLALGGAALGCVLAAAGIKGLIALIPPDTIPQEAIIRLNPVVLLFAVSASMLTALIFGLAPALHLARRQLAEPLKDTGKGVSGGFRHGKLRAALVAAEVALSLVLLVGAGLLMRSFFALENVELGLNPKNILVVRLPLPKGHYETAAQKQHFFQELLRRLHALPGVVAASETSTLPMYGGIGSDLEVPGKTHADRWNAIFQLCSERYFDTLGIRLLKGRALTEGEVNGARKVAVVNQTLVRKYFGTDDPIGRQIKLTFLETAPDPVKNPVFDIVGVVADAKNQGIQDPPTPEVFIPYTITGSFERGILVRTSDEPLRLLNAVRKEIWSVDRNVALTMIDTLENYLRQFSYAQPRFGLLLLAVFASVGLALAAIGVYSVIAYTVSRQTHEIGIRMAIGADRGNIMRMIIGMGLKLMAIGAVAGVLASLALTRLIASQIWGVSAYDPVTLTVVIVLLGTAGLAACYFPARRATKVDPLVALRYE